MRAASGSALVAALLLTLAACDAKGPAASSPGPPAAARPVIAVVPKGQAHIFWQTVKAGAVAAGREGGAEILWQGPETETQYAAQVALVENFIARKVSAIVLAPTERKALVPAIDKAAAAGIPVVIFDSGAETENYVSFVATDNFQGGAIAARRMAEVLGKKGSVAVVGVAAGSQSTMERERGFQETLAKEFPDVKVVDFQYSDSDRSKALQVAENFLTKHADLDGIFGPNESSAVGAAQAVRGKGRAGKVKVVGFDSSETLVQGLTDGVIDSLVVQNPFRMGQEGVRCALQKLRGETPPRRIDTGVALITKDNMNTPDMQRLLSPPKD